MVMRTSVHGCLGRDAARQRRRHDSRQVSGRGQGSCRHIRQGTGGVAAAAAVRPQLQVVVCRHQQVPVQQLTRTSCTSYIVCVTHTSCTSCTVPVYHAHYPRINQQITWREWLNLVGLEHRYSQEAASQQLPSPQHTILRMPPYKRSPIPM